MTFNFFDSQAIAQGWPIFWSAFLGAFFAFTFNQLIEYRKIRKSRVAAANAVLHTLLLNLGRLESIRNQSINPYRDNPARPFIIQPILGIDGFDTYISLQDLDFLLSGKNPGVLLELLNLQDSYNAWLQLIRKRNLVHEKEIQVIIGENGFAANEPINLKKLESAIGDRVFITITQLTNELVYGVDRLIKSHKSFFKKFRKEVKSHFIRQKLIGFYDEMED